MPQKTIELLKAGKTANIDDKFREHNILQLPSEGNILITGDIHGHLRNLERIISFSDLQNNPGRHVVLQEIIHGGAKDCSGNCISYKTLFKAVRFKLDFPHNVHFIMGNHDTAFICNNEVMKNGIRMNQSMHQALTDEFASAAEDVEIAIKQFLFSQPLAARTGNGVWMSHSLPNECHLDEFDCSIFQRDIQLCDCKKGGQVYLLTWGRRFTEQSVNKLSEKLNCEFFILGHQPQEKGWCRKFDNTIILASDHEHGCFMSIDLAQPYSVDILTEQIRPFSSVQ